MGLVSDTLLNPLSSLRLFISIFLLLGVYLVCYFSAALSSILFLPSFYFAHSIITQLRWLSPTPSSFAPGWQSTVVAYVKLCGPVLVQIHAVQLQLHSHNYKHKHMKSPQAILWQLPRVLLNSEEHYEIALKKYMLDYPVAEFTVRTKPGLKQSRFLLQPLDNVMKWW